MSYPVRYRCPRCGAVTEIHRSGYLADRSVTPYPLEGWTYVAPSDNVEADDIDGIRIECGSNATATDGCGEPFYVSYVRFEDGDIVDGPHESEFVEIRTGPSTPRWPRGP